MGKLMQWRLSVVLVVSTGCGANGLCEDEPWRNWCDDGRVMGCEEDPGVASFGSLVEVREVCKEQGMTCMAQSDDAACVHRDRPCEPDQEGLCRDGQHVTCTFGFESAAEDCKSMMDSSMGKRIASSGSYCVAHQSGLSAGCSVVESGCPVNGETRCHPLDYDDGTGASAKLTCGRGLWTLTETCPENTECIALAYRDAGVELEADVDAGAGPDAGLEMDHECALSDEPCPENAASLCDGSQIGRCDDRGYPRVFDECDEEEICTELTGPDDMIMAYCILSLEPCPLGVHSRCVGNVVGHCDRTGYPEKSSFDDECSTPGMTHPPDADCVQYEDYAQCEPMY